MIKYDLQLFDKKYSEIVQRISMGLDNGVEKKIFFESKLDIEKVSVSLVAVQTIYVMVKKDGIIDTLYNTYKPTPGDVPLKRKKILLFIDTEEQEDLRFFTVTKDDNGEDAVIWTDKLLLDANNPNDIAFQIGFKTEEEGEYENNIYICEVDTAATNPSDILDEDEIIHTGTILVHSSAEGEDERYRMMFSNFGIPDPIKYMDVFKENVECPDNIPNYDKYDANINTISLNKKSKELYLSYADIFPYVGTYKALANAVDFLGYDDVYFKEWFKEIGDNHTMAPRYVSYETPYKTGGKSILNVLPIERRISLKKMNWLTMVYKISEFKTDKDGEIEYDEYSDNVRVPKIKINYSNYEANEILVKLIGLKEWIEKYIIGLNCRIIEINGEGIVVERYKNRIYGKTTEGTDYYSTRSITPYILNESTELRMKDSSTFISIKLKEEDEEDFLEKNKRFVIKAMATLENSALDEYDSSTGTGIASQLVLIQDGEIFFDPKNIKKNGAGSESEFINKPIIQIERANLRDPNKPWNQSIMYSIDNDGDDSAPYRIISHKDISINQDTIIYTKKDYVSLRPTVDASGNITGSIKYTYKNNFNIPLFIIKGYTDMEIGQPNDNNEYVLEILDGKFIFDELMEDGSTRNVYLNFNFDTNSLEQTINVNYVYTRNVSLETQQEIKEYQLRNYLSDIKVFNIGDYIISVYGFDEYNSIYCNTSPTKAHVYMMNPNIYIFNNNENSNNNSDFYNKNANGKLIDTSLSIDMLYDEIDYGYTIIGKEYSNRTLENEYEENEVCTFKPSYLLNDVSVNVLSDGTKELRYVTYPTISYAVDTPKHDDIMHLMNITDKFNVTNIEKIYEGNKLKVWLDRNDLFKAYSLNDGVTDDSGNVIDYNRIQDVNVVIYNTILSRIIYEKQTKLFYDTSIGQCYIMVDDTSEMGELFSNQDIYPLYIEAFYSIRVNTILQSNDKKYLNVTLDSKYYLYKIQPFTKGQKVKLTFTESVGDNIEAKSQIVFTVIGYNNGTVYLEGNINLSFLSSTDLYYHKWEWETEPPHKSNNFTINIPDTEPAWTLYAPTGYDVEENIEEIENIINGDKEDKIDLLLYLANIDDRIIRIEISHAHQVYVDYEIEVDYAKEFIRGYTNIYPKNDEFLTYVDNTFSVTTRNFDIHNAYRDWLYQDASSNLPYVFDTSIYGYNIPVTILENQGIILTADNDDMTDDINKRYAFWRIYKYDNLQDKNVLMYELWNSSVFINPSIEGIYSVELYMYDSYGNLTKKFYQGVFKTI